MDQSLILAIAIALLSVSLTAVGIYAVLILRDFHRTLGHANKILSRIDTITEHIDTNLIRPASSVAGILALIREGAQMVGDVRALGSQGSATAKVISGEIQEVAKTVKDELLPAVTAAAKDVVQDIAEQVKQVPTEASDQAKEVTSTVATEAKAVVTEAKLASKPEPMAAKSLSSSRRRFFTKKR